MLKRKNEKVKKNVSIYGGLNPNAYNAYIGLTASGKPDKGAVLSKCQETGNLFWHDRLSQTVLRNEGKIACDGVHQQLSEDSTMDRLYLV